MSIIKYSS